MKCKPELNKRRREKNAAVLQTLLLLHYLSVYIQKRVRATSHEAALRKGASFCYESVWTIIYWIIIVLFNFQCDSVICQPVFPAEPLFRIEIPLHFWSLELRKSLFLYITWSYIYIYISNPQFNYFSLSFFFVSK